MSRKEVRYYRATDAEKEKLLRRIREVLSRKKEVLVAIIYGSFTHRDFFRDLDLAVYTGGLVNDALRLEGLLCLELSKVAKMPVDVRIVDNAPAWFRLRVIREGRVLYERVPGTYAFFLKEAVGDYQDLKLCRVIT